MWTSGYGNAARSRPNARAVPVAAAAVLLLLPGTAVAQGAGGEGGATPSTTTTTQPGAPTTTPATSTSLPPASPPTGPIDTMPRNDFIDPDQPPPEPPPRESLIPPPIDLTALNAVLERKRADAEREARAVADTANATAFATVASLSSKLDDLSGQLPASDKAVESARVAERAAVTELERARSREAELAVESYTQAISGSNPTLDATAALMSDPENFERFVRTTEYSDAAWRSIARGVTQAESDLSETQQATESALAVRQRLERKIGAAQEALGAGVADAERIEMQGQVSIEAAATIGDDLAVDGLGPTIVGETLLTAEDLAAFSARRSGVAPSVDLLELARFFVLEGTAEGVRADIAWAQSILETGNFGYAGSMVSVSDNNYAGIGACDSCSGGFDYATPQLGVRAQIQLLHTYADDNLSTEDLAFPPPGSPPESSSVRGCCDTWMELSGVWATGPGYGVKILTIYNEMLVFAAQRQRDAEAFAALAAATSAGAGGSSAGVAPPTAPAE